MFKFEIQSCVRGYHIYQAIWSSTIGEVLNCAREPRNRTDPFAVATKKAGGVVVGHVPREFSCVFSTFLLHGGSITCTITGGRRFSSDLPQGGLELPCIYTLSVINI